MVLVERMCLHWLQSEGGRERGRERGRGRERERERERERGREREKEREILKRVLNNTKSMVNQTHSHKCSCTKISQVFHRICAVGLQKRERCPLTLMWR